MTPPSGKRPAISA